MICGGGKPSYGDAKKIAQRAISVGFIQIYLFPFTLAYSRNVLKQQTEAREFIEQINCSNKFFNPQNNLYYEKNLHFWS